MSWTRFRGGDRRAGRQLWRQTFRPIAEVLERGGEQHQQGDALFDGVRILVQSQRGGQRGQSELVDAQGAGQRMLVDLVDAGAVCRR